MKDLDIDKIKRAVQYHQDKRQGELFSKGKVKKEKESTEKKGSILVVPNRTTYMKVGKKLDKDKVKDPKKPEIPKDTKFLSSFTPVQLKIVVFLIKEIQKFIQPQLESVSRYAKNKTNKNRAELVNGHKTLIEKYYGSYYCDIPKRLFVSGRNYARLEDEIHSLAWIPVQFKTRHPKTNKIGLKSTTLFSIWQELYPEKEKDRTVTIEIQYDVLMLLSSINVAPKGEVKWDCDYYNKICYDVIMYSKKKYTGLLYLYLSPWRNKGGWRVLTEELKAVLGIVINKYPRNIDFKNRVLNPSAKELRNNGDFWFEANFKGNYTVFKIITVKTLDKQNEEIGIFINLLKSIHLEETHLKCLNKIIANPQFHKKSKKIISQCIEKYYDKKNSENKIYNLPDYIYTALKRFNDGVKLN